MLPIDKNYWERSISFVGSKNFVHVLTFLNKFQICDPSREKGP